jgi:hypothetical protein
MAGETTTHYPSPAVMPRSRTANELLAWNNQFEVVATELETDDVVGAHKLYSGRAGVTLVGLIVKTDDLDTGTPTLAWDIKFGSTTIKAAVGNDALLAGVSYFFDPITVTSDTAVTMTAGTAANVGAAGTVSVTAIFHTLD